MTSQHMSANQPNYQPLDQWQKDAIRLTPKERQAMVSDLRSMADWIVKNLDTAGGTTTGISTRDADLVITE